MKMHTFAVVVDTGCSVDTKEQYDEACVEINKGMQAFAEGVPAEDYVTVGKPDSHELVGGGHEIAWVIEAQPFEGGHFEIFIKIMLDLRCSCKPDVVKIDIKRALVGKLLGCPALKVSKKYVGCSAADAE